MARRESLRWEEREQIYGGGEELAPLRTRLRAEHDVLPYLEQLIPVSEAEFRRLPDNMVDLLAGSADFSPLARGSGSVFLQISGAGAQAAEIVIARPEADGEIWMIAPVRPQH